MTYPLSAAQIREIAVEASADPRSVRRVLAGERLRTMADDRVRSELARRGIALPEPSKASPQPEHAA